MLELKNTVTEMKNAMASLVDQTQLRKEPLSLRMCLERLSELKSKEKKD